MALPTAQLGQMSSLNVPTSMPRPYERDPGLLKQALAQILVATAVEGGKTGVGNLMSQDYAAEAGQTPATTWERLTRGPRVGREDMRQIRTERGADSRLDKSLTTQKSLAEMREQGDDQRLRKSQEFTKGENERGRKFTSEQTVINNIADAQKEFGRLVAERSSQDRLIAAQNARAKAELDALTGLRTAQTGKTTAEARQIDAMLNMMERLTTPPTITAAPEGPTAGRNTPFVDLGDVTGQLGTGQGTQSREAFQRMLAEASGQPVTAPAPAQVPSIPTTGTGTVDPVATQKILELILSSPQVLHIPE